MKVKMMSVESMLMLVLLAAAIYFAWLNRAAFMGKTSKYARGIQGADLGYEGGEEDADVSSKGVGLASSLLPKDVAAQEDFGEFAPDEILKGQKYLNPRAMIGYPETIGGSLRNSNQQVRSEPPNPRKAVSIFNTSTIVGDQMRPAFEIGQGSI